MNKFFKLAILTFLLTGFLLAGFAAAGVPDPADSVIIESKIVNADSGACASAKLKVKVIITNKDSLANITLPILTTSTQNGGYAILSRAVSCIANRNFAAAFNVLIDGGTTSILKSRLLNNSRYNSVSPDTIALFMTLSDPTDDTEKLPPNSSRVDLGEIKFDSIRTGSNPGLMVIDSGKVLSNTIQFVNLTGGKIDVNLKTSTIQINIPTDVKDIDKGRIPTVYSLAQNYPNPFNANTQISFALPKSGNARLDIYNVLGQKVTTLLNEYLTAGSKTVNWDGRDDNGVGVPSGVYFYQLAAQDFRQTKKMLLIK